MSMKIWIERHTDAFFIYLTEPTHVEGDAGWVSEEGGIEFFPSPKERKQLNQYIDEGQVAEFKLKTCWEPV